jgi:hypothetical protein
MDRCFLFILLVSAHPGQAQLLFKNLGQDTLRFAVGTFYDTANRTSIMTSGWYSLKPHDSIVIGELQGPAVYYYVENFFDSVYADTISTKYVGARSGYRESLMVQRYIAGSDAQKFTFRKANHMGVWETYQGSRNYTVRDFRPVLVPERAKNKKTFVIELRRQYHK